MKTTAVKNRLASENATASSEIDSSVNEKVKGNADGGVANIYWTVRVSREKFYSDKFIIGIRQISEWVDYPFNWFSYIVIWYFAVEARRVVGLFLKRRISFKPTAIGLERIPVKDPGIDVLVALQTSLDGSANVPPTKLILGFFPHVHCYVHFCMIFIHENEVGNNSSAKQLIKPFLECRRYSTTYFCCR